MTERTLAIVKPDAVERHVAGRIIQRIEDGGFQIRAMRRVHLTGQDRRQDSWSGRRIGADRTRGPDG